MIDADDNFSMHRNFGPVVADDFVSDGRVITVPEPGILALFGLGIAGLSWSRRKRA